jgi:hypothetical protein
MAGGRIRWLTRFRDEGCGEWGRRGEVANTLRVYRCAAARDAHSESRKLQRGCLSDAPGDRLIADAAKCALVGCPVVQHHNVHSRRGESHHARDIAGALPPIPTSSPFDDPTR